MCLVGRGKMGGGGGMVGPNSFLSRPTETQSPHIGEKIRVKTRSKSFFVLWTKLPQAATIIF